MISPSEFAKVFSQVVKSRKQEQEIVRKWYSAEEFTQLMLRRGPPEASQGILPDVATSLRLQYYREYWNLDAVMFEERDVRHFGFRETYAKYLSVVVEHENVASTAHAEVNKLMTINAPLRVLITYARPDESKSLLSVWKGIVEQADWDQSATANRHFLVVLGFLEESIPHWRYYEYTKNGFAPCSRESATCEAQGKHGI
jgi:hypothetical protein